MYRKLQRSNTLRYKKLTKAEQVKIRYLGYHNKGKTNTRKSKELLDNFDYEDIMPTDEQWEALGIDEYRASQMEKDLEAIQEFAVSEGHTIILEVSGLKYNWVIQSIHGRQLVSITVGVDSLLIDRHHVPDYVPYVARRVEDIIWPWVNNSFLDALNALDGEFEGKSTSHQNNEMEETDVYPQCYDDFNTTMEISLGPW